MAGFGRIVDLRNNTTSDILIPDLGVVVPANASAATTNVLRISDFVDAATLDASVDLDTLLTAGDVAINGHNGNGDGTADTNLSLVESQDEFSLTTVDSATTEQFQATDQGGLDFDVSGGTVNVGGTIYTPGDASLSLTDATTNYVFVNAAGSITSNTSAYPSDGVPLYQVVTAGGDITSVTDERAYLTTNQLGETGLQGIQGETGTLGPQGNQGATGLQGSQGTQGIQGETGTLGPQGNQGATGLQGSQGTTGTQGVPGAQGTTGVGTQGATGLQGTAGSAGVQGETGVDGTAGAQGITGLRGITGAAPQADMPAVHLRRTTAYAITTTMSDITFDTTDIENDTSILEHDNSNTDRILIHDTGLYLIGYGAQIDAPSSASTHVIDFEVRINDTTVIPCSNADTTVFNDSSIPTGDMDNWIGHSFLVELTDGDFISLRGDSNNGTGTVNTDPHMIFWAVRQTGVGGPQGETGPAGGPAGATGVQGETGVAGSTMAGNFYEAGTTTIAGSNVTIDLDNERFDPSGNYTLSGGQVTVANAGDYMITYDISTLQSGSSSRSEISAWLEQNSSEVAGSRTEMYLRQANYGASGSATVILTLAASDVLRIRAVRTAGSGTLATRANGSRLTIHKV